LKGKSGRIKVKTGIAKKEVPVFVFICDTLCLLCGSLWY